jgi:hypothetical protein
MPIPWLSRCSSQTASSYLLLLDQHGASFTFINIYPTFITKRMITETLAQGVVTITSTESVWGTSPLDGTLVIFCNMSSSVKLELQSQTFKQFAHKKVQLPDRPVLRVWPNICINCTALASGGATIFATAL